MKMIIVVHNNESRQKQAHCPAEAPCMAIAPAALASVRVLLFLDKLFDLSHNKPGSRAEHLPTSTRCDLKRARRRPLRPTVQAYGCTGHLGRHARVSRMLGHAGRGMCEANLTDLANATIPDAAASPTRDRRGVCALWRSALAHLYSKSSSKT